MGRLLGEACAGSPHARTESCENLKATKDKLKKAVKALILHLPCKVLDSLDLPGRRWQQKVGAPALLCIAFSGRRTVDLAVQHSISASWVMALRAYVVSLLLASQNLLLGSLIMMALRDPPLAVMTRLAWDETGERLALSGDEYGASTWHVLVARMRLLILWEDPAKGTRC